MKNPEMLREVPDHLKTKKMCKHAVKKLPFVLRYVLHRHKTQQMSDKTILENGEALLIHIRPKKCVIKLLIIMLMH